MPRLRFETPVDPAATLKRLVLVSRDPTFRIREGEIWVAFRTRTGPAAVRYARASEHAVDVDAWGPGAEEAIARAPEHLGALDRPESFVTEHPVIAPLAKRARGLRFGRTGRLFERLVPVILGQKVTGEGAGRSWRELVFRYGERAPGPQDTLWIPPSAERVRELAYYDWHPLGVERRRAETILEVAKRARRLEPLDRDEALKRLAAMSGIGPWTLGHVASAVYGDADAVPVGDYHLPHLVSYVLAGEPRADDARMLELLEPFRPHRGRVVALLQLGGKGPERRGPRLSVRDIRGQ